MRIPKIVYGAVRRAVELDMGLDSTLIEGISITEDGSGLKAPGEAYFTVNQWRWDSFFAAKYKEFGEERYNAWLDEQQIAEPNPQPTVPGFVDTPISELKAPPKEQTPAKPSDDIGAKYDTGKPMWGLLFTGCRNTLRGIVAVLNYGAMKYPKPPLFNSWRDVPGATKRYHEAFLRHSNELDGIEGLFKLDEESGLPAIDHVITNLIFIRELNQELIMHNIRTWQPPPEGSKGFDLNRTLTAQNICTENERLTNTRD